MNKHHVNKDGKQALSWEYMMNLYSFSAPIDFLPSKTKLFPLNRARFPTRGPSSVPCRTYLPKTIVAHNSATHQQCRNKTALYTCSAPQKGTKSSMLNKEKTQGSQARFDCDKGLCPSSTTRPLNNPISNSCCTNITHKPHLLWTLLPHRNDIIILKYTTAFPPQWAPNIPNPPPSSP